MASLKDVAKLANVSLTIHTDYRTLTHKCSRVDLINQAEYLLRFSLSSQHKEHVNIRILYAASI